MNPIINHQWKYYGKDKNTLKKRFFVKCPHTGGEFSTNIWDTGDYSNGQCPCCGCNLNCEERY